MPGHLYKQAWEDRTHGRATADGSALSVISQQNCPCCNGPIRAAARYCPRCGAACQPMTVPEAAGHPTPLPAPKGSSRCEGQGGVYFRWFSAWGHAPLGAETMAVMLYNTGYDLRNVMLDIRGTGVHGEPRLTVRHEIEFFARGRELRIEVPSYEMNDEVKNLTVSIVSAEQSSED